MDRSWYLDVNRFARSTVWAHGMMTAYALWVGVAALGVLLVLGWWLARSHGTRAVAAAVWAAVGTLVAVALNQPLGHLVGRVRPYDTIHGVEVLVPRANDFTFPSDHATAAGAAICGLFLARRWVLAWIAAGVGLFLAFARVYVGAHYPTDVVAGLLFGAAVTAVLYPLAMWLGVPVVAWVARTPLRFLVVSRRGPEQPEPPGPAPAMAGPAGGAPAQG